MPKLTKKKGILAWHFTRGMHLRDMTPLVAGKTYRYSGPLRLCASGYHASIKAIDALSFAPGTQVSRVLCWGNVLQEKDKLVCTRRTVIKTVDASETLHTFARWCALQVADQWDCPAIVRRYLDTGDESARIAAWAAARAAAPDAAWAAAWAAAPGAAPGAAWASARDAAWASAPAAAWAAAQDAALAVARDAARDAARGAAWASAWAAAWDAAWRAARQKQNDKLEEMLMEALK